MFRSAMFYWCLGFLLTLGASTSATVSAQVLYGSVLGNIKDPSDAPVPGASVIITNKDTRQTRETLTNDAGGYSFATVLSGVYDVKVTKAGFSTAARNDIIVSINSIARADMTLQIGAVSDTVLVEAQAAGLQTDRSEVHDEITTRQLEELPVPLGRNYQQLFRTLPGFSPPGNAHSIPSNPSRALVFNVNGASQSSNNTRIDGASSTNVWLPHVTAYVPALESIEAVNVVTNSFDAEQGLAGGAAINVQIKSGTNDLHGSAFEYHSDQHLNAKPFFTPGGTVSPKYVYNQYGGTIGGPILKNKLFYFLSYEGTNDRRNVQRFVTVPTAQMKSGDVSASSRPVYDPATGDERGANRSVFPGNIIPLSRIDPIVSKIASLIPLPNITGRLTNNYFASAPFSFDRHTGDSKVNYNVSSKLTLFERFSMLHYDSYNRQVFGDQLGGRPIGGGNPGYGNGDTYSLTSGGTYLISPTFIVDAYFGWTKMNTDSQQPRLDEKVGLDVLGIPGTNGPRRFEGGWPRIAVSGFATLGINENFMPYFRRDPQYQGVFNLNWTRGTHNVRFGGELYHQQLNHTQPEFPNNSHAASGGFIFGGGPTTTRGGQASNQYNSWGTFLLGLPTQMGKLLLVPDVITTRLWLYSFYARDQWTIAPRVTLSYGLRWEYFPFPTRADRGMERYDATSNQMLICGLGSIPRDCGVQESRKHFAPRVGIAWRATSTLVVRAGYGLTNDPYSLALPLRTNYPLLLPVDIRGPNSFQPAGRLAAGLPQVNIPDPANSRVNVPSNIDVVFTPSEIRRGYLQSWNLTVQKQLNASTTAQAGYVATREIRHFGQIDVNAGQVIGGGEDGRPLLQKFGRTGATILEGPVGNTRYDSLQTNLTHRFAQGVQFSTNYTWSKAIGIAGLNHGDDTPQVQALAYLSRNHALADYDRTHNLAISSVWELPFGRGKRWLNANRFQSMVLGGWQVNTILSFISGDPFSITGPDESLDLPGSTQTADQVKKDVRKIGGTGPGQKYYDPTAFVSVDQPRFGNAGFNNLRNPGVANWDLGLFREFAISERWKLQFRAEAFNASNTPHFDSPDSDPSSDTFMEINSTRSLAREGVDARQLRFGLRFSW